ncbi:MAG: bifunctional metallophosphatase/5'-nucleotidase [Bacteroidota bacterium]
MLRSLPLLAALLFALSGCISTVETVVVAPPTPEASGDEVHLTILHINDVYEITPVAGGEAGGMARVGGLLRQLRTENPNTIAVLAGDYLSPSALGTARVDGERLAGRQMVAVLNAMGLDVAALGNHEFDVSEEAFRARMVESEFTVISGNARAARGFEPFEGVDEHALLTVGPDEIRVGLVGTVLPSTVKDYVAYGDMMDELAADAQELDGQSEVLIGLTHLAFADDARAAATIPELDLVLGGHEHDNIQAYRGADLTPVLKADANARTVFVHRVVLDRASGEMEVTSTLVPMTPETPEDPEVAAEVQRWVDIAFAGFRAQGFEPERMVVELPVPLDGRESTIRTQSTELGTAIADGFRAASGAPLAVFNGGSVRIDDVLSPGAFTEYDAIRVMPFGGEVVTIEMPGRLVARLLDQGVANAGTGGFLQTSGFGGTAGAWTVDGEPIDPNATYTVASNDFLVSGREANLDWFSIDGNPEITQIGEFGDVRQAFIAELKRRYE